MLNGVSHDLRTILTRFKLSLALLDNSADSEFLQKDVDEMGQMLEGYLAFARGDTGESTARINIRSILEDLRADSERHGAELGVETRGDLDIRVRPIAMKRCVGNLVANAQRHADRVRVSAIREAQFVSIVVDDDGSGIAPLHREDVFRPFYRLDDARNQDEGGAGLGLAIARDIARSHGGDITLSDSPMGGLKGRGSHSRLACVRRKELCPHTDALIHRDNSLFGPAPVLVATCWPPLKTISVGIERMPYLLATAGFSSTLSLAIFTLPFISLAISSSAGAIILQGPHHSAQKSTMTGSLDLMTSASKLESVTLAVNDMAPSGYRGASAVLS